MYSVTNIIDELDSRMENIKVYAPFFQIRRNQNDYHYDLAGLCMAMLSFILYEGKLKMRGLKFSDLKGFVNEFVSVAYQENLNQQQATEITSLVLDKLQNGGIPFKYIYYNYKLNKERYKNIKLVVNTTQEPIEYSITNDGIDFFLKTKEFPEESQLTISLLLFRQQVKTRSFDYALGTIRELNIRVQKALYIKTDLLNMLMYGGLNSRQEYEKYHTNVQNIFSEQKDLFNEVRQMLIKIHQEYIDKIEKDIMTEDDRLAFVVIQHIQDEMKSVRQNHGRLLNEVVKVINEYDKILNLRYQSAFSVKFDFKNELEKVVAQNNNPERLRYLFGPLLDLAFRKQFNPLRALAPQRLIIEQPQDEDEQEDSEPIEWIGLDDLTSQRQENNFLVYIGHLAQMFIQYQSFNLSTWVKELQKDLGQNIITNSDLIAFLIRLNHGKPAGKAIKVYNLKELKATERHRLGFIEQNLCRAMANSSITYLEIETEPEKNIEFGSIIKVTNLIFRGVE